MIPVSNFNTFAANVHSQFGEDGIIEELLHRLERSTDGLTKYCVEFGAWDGKHLSNTYRLIDKEAYHAVLIEADRQRFNTLCANLPQPSVTKINEFVTFDGANTLDGLLAKTDIPIRFDVLSIDIDGNDYHVLDSLCRYKPKVICIEFNPSIPNDVQYVQPRDFGVKHGSSAAAIAALAARKGYAVVAATVCNLLLVDRNHLPDIGLMQEPTLHEVRDDRGSRVYAFCGYDGSIILSRPLRLIWHGLTVSDQSLQLLPRSLRRFKDDYNVLQKLWFVLFLALRRPSIFATRTKDGYNVLQKLWFVLFLALRRPSIFVTKIKDRIATWRTP